MVTDSSQRERNSSQKKQKYVSNPEEAENATLSVFCHMRLHHKTGQIDQIL